jgi:hypothetical protein
MNMYEVERAGSGILGILRGKIGKVVPVLNKLSTLP